MNKVLYKIQQQFIEGTSKVSKYYTVVCYLYSPGKHTNEELWSIRNLERTDVARYLQSSTEQPDTEFAFVIVDSKNGPAILTGQGNLLAVPVKKSIKVKKNETSRILSRTKHVKVKKETTGAYDS